MKSLAAYYRVSTNRQQAKGLGLEAQRAAVLRYAGSVGGNVVAEFSETESGRVLDCARLMKVLALDHPAKRSALAKSLGLGRKKA